MGNDPNNQNDQRQPEQQRGTPQQQQPNQQNQQGGGERIDTDGDGRTRDPNDTRPTDDGGRDAPVER
jgi:hypothetical protein